MPATYRGSEGRSKAGKKGGDTTAARYGEAHYRMIGRMGGRARGRSRRRDDIESNVPSVTSALQMATR